MPSAPAPPVVAFAQPCSLMPDVPSSDPAKAQVRTGTAQLEAVPPWCWELPLGVFAFTLGVLGAFGWLHRARAFDAIQQTDWSVLDPIWPVYVIAAIGCVAAQFILIGAARYLQRPRRKLVPGLVFAVMACVSGFSGHQGVAIVFDGGARAEYQALQETRSALQSEMRRLETIIDEQRRQLPLPGSVGPRSMAAAVERFRAATAPAHDRLSQARAELAALPLSERDKPHRSWLVLLFFAWSLLEPWCFALRDAEVIGASRDITVSQDERVARDTAATRRPLIAGLMGLMAALVGPDGHLVVARDSRVNATSGGAVASPSEGGDVPPDRDGEAAPDATSLAPTRLSTAVSRNNARAQEGSRRRFPRRVIARAIERYRAGEPVDNIAREAGCHRAQVYRWLAHAAVPTRRASVAAGVQRGQSG